MLHNGTFPNGAIHNGTLQNGTELQNDSVTKQYIVIKTAQYML